MPNQQHQIDRILNHPMHNNSTELSSSFCIGRLYHVIDGHRINLYEHNLHNIHGDGYKLTLVYEQPKNKVFMFMGVVRGVKIPDTIYYRFLNGSQIVYMIKSIVYLEELR